MRNLSILLLAALSWSGLPFTLHASVPDYTDRLERLGNPFTSRFGSPTGAFNDPQKIFELIHRDGQVWIAGGSSDNRGGTDLWSWVPEESRFNLAIHRTHQEEFKQFRIFDDLLLVNDEDHDRVGANIHFYRDGEWHVRFLNLAQQNPLPDWDIAASGHNRDAYYFDGKFIATTTRTGDQFIQVSISEDYGETWRLATADTGTINFNVQRYIEFDGKVYAMPSKEGNPIYRFPGSNGHDFEKVYDNMDAAGFPESYWLSNPLEFVNPRSFFHVYERQFADSVFYVVSNRLWRITQMEPQVQVSQVTFTGVPGVAANRVAYVAHPRDGVLRALVNDPINSGPNQGRFLARLLETTDGTNWSEAFRVVTPSAGARAQRIDQLDSEFYLSFDPGLYQSNIEGASYVDRGSIYRISLAEVPRPSAKALSFARIRLNWRDQTDGAAGWEIQRRDPGQESWNPLAATVAAERSFEDTGLTANSRYIYRVRALFGDGTASDWSLPVSALTGPDYLLPPSADAFVVGGNPDNNYGHHQFLNVKQHGSRKAYLRFDIRDLDEPLRRAALRMTFHRLDWASGDLANGMVFRLYALNPGTTPGNGKLGENWGETEITWNNAPANQTGSGNLLLTGSGTANGGQARFIMDVTVPGDFQVGDSVYFESQALLEFLNNAPRGPVTFALTRMTGGSGSNSEFASREHNLPDHRPQLITVAESALPPPPPSNLAAAPISPTEVDLAWTSPNDAFDSFEIVRRSGLSPWEPVASLQPPTNSFSDQNLIGLTPYTYRIRARSLAGASEWSNEVSIITAEAPRRYAPVSLADWRFNEAAGTTALDRSGNGAHFHFASLPSWTDDPARGHVVELDGGVAAEAEVHGLLDNLDTLTLAAWVRPESLDDSNRFLLSKRTTASTPTFSLFFGSGNRLYVDLASSGNRISTNQVFSNNQWYHIAVVFNGNYPAAERARIYVNGQLDRTGSITASRLPSNSAPVTLAKAQADANPTFAGRLSAINLFPEAHGPAVVRAIMDASQIPGHGAMLPPLRATGSDGSTRSPNEAIDYDDPSSRWAAEGPGQWLQVDLGSVVPVQAVSIAWFNGHQRRSFFNLSVSTDGESFTQVFDGSSSGTTEQPELYSFDRIDARFVRMTGFGNSSNNWNTLYAIRIFAGEPEPPTGAFGGFSRWLETYFTSAERNDPLRSDPAASLLNDGVANLVKYHLGLDPRVDRSAGLPVLRHSPDSGKATFSYWRAVTARGTTGTVQWSSDLSSWSSEGIIERITERVGNQEHVEAEITQDDSAQLFLRLKVTAE